MRGAFIAVTVLSFAATSLVNDSVLRQAHGWDADLYCVASRLDAAGGNPYSANGLSWLYPPALLNVFIPVCAQNPPLMRDHYPFVYQLVALLCVHWWRPGSQWLLALICAAGAFVGLSWCLWTGNIDVVLLLPISFAFHAIGRNRLTHAAVWLATVAAVKLLPLVYLAIFLVVPGPWLDRRRAMVAGVTMFVVCLLLLTLTRPGLAGWYVRDVTGFLPGEHSAAAEVGHITQPAFPYALTALLRWPNDPSSLVPGMLLAAVIVGAMLLAAWRLGGVRLPPSEQLPVAFAYLFLAIHLLLPRLKPYSFVWMAPAVFWLLKRQRPGTQAALLITVIVWPALALWSYVKQTGWLPTILTMYSQTWSLVTLLVALPLIEWRRRPIAADGMVEPGKGRECPGN